MLKTFCKKIIFSLFLAVALNFQLLAHDSFEKKDEKITLNFNHINVNAALRYLSELNNNNLIIDEIIQGKLSIYLHDVSWEQALDCILQTRGLAKHAIPHGWFITTAENLLKQEKMNADIQKEKNNLCPLIFKVIPIHYRKASDFLKLLKDKTNTLLSVQAIVNADNLTNSLWIKDFPIKMNRIIRLIKELDKPIGQILIEARVVSIDQNKEKELGAQFNLGKMRPVNDLLKSTLRNEDSNQNTYLLQHLTMDLPLFSANSLGLASLGLRLLNLGKNSFLDLELSALEKEGAAEVISTPHLITADQQPAFIEAGDEIPYQEKASGGGTSLIFKKAVLSLKVTPQIMPQERIILDLEVNQDQPNSVMVDAPTIKARGIKTQIIVKSGETIVLGGVYEYSQGKLEQRVPFLGSLPLIGRLFRLTKVYNRRSELLIFLTPLLLRG